MRPDWCRAQTCWHTEGPPLRWPLHAPAHAKYGVNCEDKLNRLPHVRAYSRRGSLLATATQALSTLRREESRVWLTAMPISRPALFSPSLPLPAPRRD